MATSLSTYLSDHLTGAMFAVELLKHLRDAHGEEPLGRLAAKMIVEIEADRQVLQKLADQIGGGENKFKEAASWLAEKTARLKLRLGGDSAFGEFETLEALSIGVWGKLKLWTALSRIARTDSRLADLDCQKLVERAMAQHDEIEGCRLELANVALDESTPSRG